MLHIEKLHRYSVILASQSPRRREILQRIPGFKFTQITSPFDEATLEKRDYPTVAAYVTTSACRKAQALLTALDDRDAAAAVEREPLVIAADTVVIQGQQILEKPTTPSENLEFLRRLSGASHSVRVGALHLLSLLPSDSMPSSAAGVGSSLAWAVELKKGSCGVVLCVSVYLWWVWCVRV
jgi:predicted house-cleaning NTP pyrophosphatase (Maf/HAM1 superfamily)